MYWGGRLIIPTCLIKNESCITNHIFPLEANLGVNKVNFYIKRFIRYNVNINSTGDINNKLTILYKNSSPPDTLVGGDYKNYFQIYLPADAKIIRITVDNQEVADYNRSRSGQFDIIGFLLSIKEQKTAIVSIQYQLKQKLVSGNNYLQTIVQKQIGLGNDDLTLAIELPDNITVIDKNFTAVAKNNSLVYNTTLARDRIFIIRLNKKR